MYLLLDALRPAPLLERAAIVAIGLSESEHADSPDDHSAMGATLGRESAQWRRLILSVEGGGWHLSGTGLADGRLADGWSASIRARAPDILAHAARIRGAGGSGCVALSAEEDRDSVAFTTTMRPHSRAAWGQPRRLVLYVGLIETRPQGFAHGGSSGVARR